MTESIDIFTYSEQILTKLSKGIFLTTAANGMQNTMTIGWGSLGFMWGKPVFTVMVRQSRYTKQLIDANAEFTVSIPMNDNFTAALALCGTKSGRNINKFAAANIVPIPGKTVSVPIIKGCGLHLECKILDTETMQEANFDKNLAAKWYQDKDWHTYYTGIITAAYTE